MSVFKRYNGERISSSHPAYERSRRWTYKRLQGRVIHRATPEAQTRREAELAERQIIKAAFDHKYDVAATTTTLAGFIENKYRPFRLLGQPDHVDAVENLQPRVRGGRS